MDSLQSITRQMAESVAAQVDNHLKTFLRKNGIEVKEPVNIEQIYRALEDKGMTLVSESETSVMGDRKTTYRLVKIIDQTHVTVKAPVLREES